mmetsp:Transcript_79334/g.230371  ORF Transcript_79334/g.230371 Transcript_79334/m.230371 type:complete len:104 (-) Transcript_79334:190-501(-)
MTMLAMKVLKLDKACFPLRLVDLPNKAKGFQFRQPFRSHAGMSTIVPQTILMSLTFDPSGQRWKLGTFMRHLAMAMGGVIFHERLVASLPLILLIETKSALSH